MTAIFSTTFMDEDDIVLSKIFMQVIQYSLILIQITYLQAGAVGGAAMWDCVPPHSSREMEHGFKFNTGVPHYRSVVSHQWRRVTAAASVLVQTRLIRISG